MGGDRKYRGAYLRGDPQNTNLPHEVVPNAKWAVSGQEAPRTTPPVMPGTQDGSSHSLGFAAATAGLINPATSTPTMTLGTNVAVPQRLSVNAHSPILTSLKGMAMKRTLLLPQEPLIPVVWSSPRNVDDVGSDPLPSAFPG
jgi:hypothetical protein